MTSAESVHPDMVIRARVKLLGVESLSHEERTRAYRLLTRVDPRYLPHLVRSLLLWNEKGFPPPSLGETILLEALDTARRIPATDPEHAPLLRAVLEARERAQLPET